MTLPQFLQDLIYVPPEDTCASDNSFSVFVKDLSKLDVDKLISRAEYNINLLSCDDRPATNVLVLPNGDKEVCYLASVKYCSQRMGNHFDAELRYNKIYAKMPN
jgi:hypothetical protein